MLSNYGSQKFAIFSGSKCEAGMFFKKLPGCNVLPIIWEILQNKINFSIEVTDDFETNVEPLSLKICLHCGAHRTSSNLEKSTKYIILDQKSLFFLYCLKNTKYEKIKWTFYFEPISPSFWVAIAICSMIYGILSKKLWNVFHILFFLINQPIVLKTPERRFFLPMAALMTITQWYLAIITMNVLVPLKPQVIQTNLDLFESGFKFLVPSVRTIDYVQEVSKPIVERLKLDFRRDYILPAPHIVQFKNNDVKPDFFSNLALVKGVYLFFRDLKDLIFSNKFGGGHFGNVTCHTVMEEWDNTQIIWMFRDYLKDTLYSNVQQLQASGILKFWYSRVNQFVVTSTNIQNICRDFEGTCETTKKLSMQSPVQIIFHALLILTLFGILLFFIELGWHFLRRRKVSSLRKSKNSSIRIIKSKQ